MKHWLYPANTKFYNVLGAFNEADSYWPVNSRVSVGDVIYIYLALPYKQIGFACDVIEVDIEEAGILEKSRPFFKKEIGDKKPVKLFMKLQVFASVALGDESPLAYHLLKQNGLKGMLMGPRKLENNPALLNYIKRNL